MIRSHGASDAGVARSNNEDAFCADEDLALFVVADGMGGHAAGELGSRLAVDSIRKFLRDAADGARTDWPCGQDPTLSDAGNRLRTAILLANEAVVELGVEDEYAGVGTTVVCALIDRNRLIVAHVGDSRLYCLTGRGLEQQTRDHTWSNAVAGPGAVDPGTHPMRHVLTKVVGTRELLEVPVTEHELVDGELLLLCTDGVHEVLEADALQALLERDGDLGARAQAVIAAAMQRGSRDNVTALLVEYREGDTRD